MNKVNTSLLDIPKDKFIYRIIRFEFLKKWFETGQLPLLSPSLWEDPFESALMRQVFPQEENRLEARGRMHGLSFSKNGISDALWRIYSPDINSIRIKTNAGILSNALKHAPELQQGNIYLGSVRYSNTKEWMEQAKKIRSLAKRNGPKAIAEAMLLKRRPFTHEEEIRLLYIDGSTGKNENLLYVTLDPHEVIQTLLIDPRTETAVAKKYKDYFKIKAGYKKSVAQSSIYQVPKF